MSDAAKLEYVSRMLGCLIRRNLSHDKGDWLDGMMMQWMWDRLDNPGTDDAPENPIGHTYREMLERCIASYRPQKARDEFLSGCRAEQERITDAIAEELKERT